jgi:hypothetical protein
MTTTPKNVVVILLDSLNRHMLGAYGGTEFETPNLDAFATTALRFDRHFTGSLPCMPARHDILCGALDFLWRPWGSVEIWEDAISYNLHKLGVVTQLISDHPHLFESGGENYHTDFMAWAYERGHEGDAWKTRPDPSWAGTPQKFGRGHMPYDDSRGWFRGEADFPGPKTMAAAERWIDENAGHHDRFFLFIDEFDPHEPFDTPEPWASKYDPDWEGPNLIWPPYMQGAIEKGVMTEREARQLRASYGGKLSMIDHWLGKVLAAIERNGLNDDTMVIITTDHGHYLGEKDIWGKPGVPIYNTLGQIPLMIRSPGIAPGACDALTTNIDIFATLADLYGITPRQRTHGQSLLPLINGTADQVRDWLVTGVWGREVHLVTKTHKYARAPVGANSPLSMMSNRWSTMPTHVVDKYLAMPLPDDRAFLDRMPGSKVPVIHQPFVAGDPIPFWARTKFTGNYLFDLENDPDEINNLAGTELEAQLAAQLKAALLELEAPAAQFERLGL